MDMKREKYVMLRGKVMNKWYDIDERAHYHITVEASDKKYDIAINIGSISYKGKIFNSSPLNIYYDEEYKHLILKEMLKYGVGITLCSDKVKLDYVRGNLFDKRKVRRINGLSKKKMYLIEIIEKNVKEAILNKDIEIFIFGNLYDNEKGIHDIHMNQGSQSPHDVNDRANNDGGIFFYNNETEKWTSLFIMFENQTLHTDEYGKAKKIRKEDK